MINFGQFHSYMRTTNTSIIQLITHAHRIKGTNEEVRFYSGEEEIQVMTDAQGHMELIPQPQFDPDSGSVPMKFAYKSAHPQGQTYYMEVPFSVWLEELVVADGDSNNISANHLYEHIAAKYPGTKFQDSHF